MKIDTKQAKRVTMLQRSNYAQRGSLFPPMPTHRQLMRRYGLAGTRKYIKAVITA